MLISSIFSPSVSIVIDESMIPLSISMISTSLIRIFVLVASLLVMILSVSSGIYMIVFSSFSLSLIDHVSSML